MRDSDQTLVEDDSKCMAWSYVPALASGKKVRSEMDKDVFE